MQQGNFSNHWGIFDSVFALTSTKAMVPKCYLYLFIIFDLVLNLKYHFRFKLNVQSQWNYALNNSMPNGNQKFTDLLGLAKQLSYRHEHWIQNKISACCGQNRTFFYVYTPEWIKSVALIIIFYYAKNVIIRQRLFRYTAIIIMYFS